jgi:hypothetical protein
MVVVVVEPLTLHIIIATMRMLPSVLSTVMRAQLLELDSIKVSRVIGHCNQAYRGLSRPPGGCAPSTSSDHGSASLKNHGEWSEIFIPRTLPNPYP